MLMEVDNNIHLNESSSSSLTLLLHTCLKSENMSAIVRFGDEWYGILQSTPDSKSIDAGKKTNLMLFILTPSQEAVNNVLTKIGLAAAKQTDTSGVVPIPVVKPVVNSYSKGCIVWYRENNLVVSYLIFF